MNIRNNGERYIGFIIVLVMFIGAIAGGFFFQARSQENSKTIRQKEKELSSVQKEIESLRRLRPDKSRIKKEYQRLLDYIPANPESEEEFLWDLGHLTEACNMKINNCSPKSNHLYLTPYPKYQVSQWQVELSGEYQSFIKFLEILPNGRRLMLVSGLEIESVSDRAGNGKLNGEYQLNAQLTLDLISTKPQEKVKK